MPRVPTLGNTTRPRSKGFHAAVGDVLVRLAPTQSEYIVSAPAAEPPRVNTGASAEEFIGIDGQVYARADFTGGEGLAWAHRQDPDENDFRRFWDSTNVIAPISDPGTPLYIEMARAHRTVDTSRTDHVDLTAIPLTQRLVVVGSGGWLMYQKLDTVNPSVVATGVLTGALQSAGLGDAAYVVNGTDQIEEIADDNDGVNATPVTLTAPGGAWSRIWEAKDRLFLAEALGGSLWEWQPGTDPVEVTAERLIDDSEAWTKVIDAGAYVAAGASNGSVYLFGPSSLEDPSLVLFSSTPLPEGEGIGNMAYNQGVLLIATFEYLWEDGVAATSTGQRNLAPAEGQKAVGRLYQARITDILTNVELVKRWYDFSQPVPDNMITTRDSIFFTLHDADAAETEVWRFLLPTLGLFREDRYPTEAATPVGYANPGQIGVLAMPSLLHVETGDATDEDSWITLSGADFFTASPKSWNEIRLTLGELPPNSEIAVLTSTDVDALDDWNHESWTTRRVIREGVSEARIPLTGVYGRYLFIQLRFLRGANLRSPRVISVTAIGRTDDEDQIEMVLPVIVSDHIERPYRKPQLSPGYGSKVRQALFDVQGQSVIIQLYRPQMSITGTVTAVQATSPYISRRGHVLEVAQVLVRGTRLSGESLSLTGGEGSLGIGLLGVDPVLGGVQSNA